VNDPKPKRAHRRPPEHVELILRLMKQYPLAFEHGAPEIDARRKVRRIGGHLLKTPEALRERSLVCRELQLAGLGWCQAASLTGFVEASVRKCYGAWERMEAV